MNVLFMSVGRRVELIRAFRSAFHSLELEGSIIGLDVDPLAPALKLADKPYLVPRLNSPEFIPQLLEICVRESVDLIFPLIDPDIPVLARHRGQIEALGVRLAVVPESASRIASDKWMTTNFFRDLGLTTPRTWLPADLNPDEVEYPLFIKPREGSAAKLTFQVRNSAELSFFLNYIPNPLVQEYLPGPEITNDVICDTKGEVLAVVSRKRIEVRWGEVAKGVTLYDPVITESCIKIAQHLPATGPVTVQCLLKDDRPYFTEINARLGGGIPLGIAAGVDSPKLLLMRAAGIPGDLPPLGSYQTGLFMTRYDDSFFLTESELQAMSGNRI